MNLSKTQQRVLVALANGYFLKSHRYLDGAKVHKLHSLAGSAETIRRTTVEHLCNQGLIDSNKKFPAATYWLTEKGKLVAVALSGQITE
jgi:hypothetical protein